ncbi:HK97 family phage prohead protease [Acinetobacter baumannii]|nr:HK97 family phage prohead protease [Acinetobacter baumannii]
MNQAYSLLTIKSIDEEKGIVYGTATTPVTDRHDDIVEPKGAKFTLPIPFLWQHRELEPVGNVIDAQVTDKGIDVTIQMVLAEQVKSVNLKERLQEAWDSIKTGLVRGMSIRLRGLKVADIQNSWGLHFFEWEWLELSAVTIPANQEATITSVKSLSASQHKKSNQFEGNETSLPCVPPVSNQPASSQTVSKHLVVNLVDKQKSNGVKLV